MISGSFGHRGLAHKWFGKGRWPHGLEPGGEAGVLRKRRTRRDIVKATLVRGASLLCLAVGARDNKERVSASPNTDSELSGGRGEQLDSGWRAAARLDQPGRRPLSPD